MLLPIRLLLLLDVYICLFSFCLWEFLFASHCQCCVCSHISYLLLLLLLLNRVTLVWIECFRPTCVPICTHICIYLYTLYLRPLIATKKKKEICRYNDLASIRAYSFNTESILLRMCVWLHIHNFELSFLETFVLTSSISASLFPSFRFCVSPFHFGTHIHTHTLSHHLAAFLSAITDSHSIHSAS